MSQLRAELVKDYLRITGKDTCYVLDICFLEHYIRDVASWKEYYRPGGHEQVIISSFFRSLGGNPKNIIYCCVYTESIDSIAVKVQSADVIILPGGCPKRGMALIENTPIKTALKHFGGKVIVGYSAGSLIQCRDFFLSPNWYYPVQEYGNGLGLFHRDWLLEVHYDGSEEMTANIRLAIDKTNRNVIAIGECGAVIVRDDGRDLLVGDARMIAGDGNDFKNNP